MTVTTRINQIRLVADYEGINLPRSDDEIVLMEAIRDHFMKEMQRKATAALNQMLYGTHPQPFSTTFPNRQRPNQQRPGHPGRIIFDGAVS